MGSYPGNVRVVTAHVSTFDALILDAYDDLSDMSAVFFSPAFLTNPNPGWRVCWNTEPAAADRGPLAVLYGSQLDDILTAYHRSVGVQKMNTPGQIRGTLVKLTGPQRVWVLTGHRDFRTGYYEGRWPD